ncbi:MAG: hypothetical protein P4L72_11840 [Parvibaculum sp.]|uniref:hypothetical protein n=1 Tax=Parvibaculum sp. TaxID=2024848 RepID=UPI0028427E36|nr:hypothetical protein [Parvibaculum sp.]MDR3499904.1 hypothetical protein [Parvibaculum sp.]
MIQQKTFNLIDAPEHVFDPDDWAALIKHFGDPAKALNRLSWRNEGIIIYQARLVAERGTIGATEAQAKLEVAGHVDKIRKALREEIRCGSLIATAIPKGGIERRNISPEIVDSIEFGFERSEIWIGKACYQHVILSYAEEQNPDESVKKCTDWLRQRREAMRGFENHSLAAPSKLRHAFPV